MERTRQEVVRLDVDSRGEEDQDGERQRDMEAW